jgi:hypothetical protein
MKVKGILVIVMVLTCCCWSCKFQSDADKLIIVENPTEVELPSEVEEQTDDETPSDENLSCGSPLSISCANKHEISEDEYIMVQIIPDTVSAKSANKWIMENHTSFDMIYGENFWMEYFDGDKWTSIEFDFMFTCLGIILFSGNTVDLMLHYFQLNLFILAERYNDSKKGRYRIIRHVTLINLGNYNLCSEFEII